MRYLPLLWACLLGQTALAQIEITSDDLPMEEDTVAYSSAAVLDIEALDLDQTGPNQEWDYSWLESVSQAEDTFFSVASSPFLYQFFFNNNFIYPDSYSTHCTRLPDLDVAGFSLENPYSYFNNNEDSYHQTGFAVTITSIPFSVPYDNHDVWFEFPLNYLDEDSCDFTSELSVPTILTWIQTGHRENIVDGWGTLITPNGTYEALRHKSVLEASDSTYLDMLGFGTNLPRFDQFTYRWIAEGMNAPVMEVVTSDVFGTETVVSVRYQDDILVIPDGVEEMVDAPELSFFPVPASSEVVFEMNRSEPVWVDVVTLSAQFVFQDWMTSGDRMDISDWKSGVYLAKVQVGNEVMVRRILVR